MDGDTPTSSRILASYQTSVGYVMIGMTQNLNENWAGHVNANKGRSA